MFLVSLEFAGKVSIIISSKIPKSNIMFTVITEVHAIIFLNFIGNFIVNEN